eukprot:7413226-Pyramimonas_sp.AAC.1
MLSLSAPIGILQISAGGLWLKAPPIGCGTCAVLAHLLWLATWGCQVQAQVARSDSCCARPLVERTAYAGWC